MLLLEKFFARMDLSDIIPWIIIIGASFLGALGKSAKSKQTGEGARRQQRGRQMPPIPTQAMPPVIDDARRASGDVVAHDDWIPSNDIPEATQSPAIMDRAWQNEGQRAIADEPQRPAAPAPDPYVAELDDGNAVPQDWKRAIIAHEILKTKF